MVVEELGDELAEMVQAVVVRGLVGVEVVVVEVVVVTVAVAVAAAKGGNELEEMVEAAVSKGCQLITTGRR